jgi:uncharacterized membrane protein HdeD (DUF308 family)
MKQVLFSNWHLMRFIRLVLVIFLFYNAFETHEWFFIAFGLFFLFQVIFNMGCGSNGCDVNFNKKK